MQVAVRITSLWIWWIAVASLVSQLFNQSTIVCASLMTEGPALRARNGSLLLSLGSGGHNRYGKGTLRFELSKRHIWKIVFSDFVCCGGFLHECVYSSMFSVRGTLCVCLRDRWRPNFRLWTLESLETLHTPAGSKPMRQVQFGIWRLLAAGS